MLLGNVPQLHELQLLNFDDGRELRIMETVAPKWKKVATAIGFNKERIEAIEEDEHYKQEKATFEMFGRWLKGLCYSSLHCNNKPLFRPT